MAERVQEIGIEPGAKREPAAADTPEEGEVIKISELEIYFPEYTENQLRAVQKAARALKAFVDKKDSSDLLHLLDKKPFLEQSDAKLDEKSPLAKLRKLIQADLI